jgi:hypothetical protein
MLNVEFFSATRVLHAAVQLRDDLILAMANSAVLYCKGMA